MTFYGEYGLLDRLTLSCSLPYKWLRSSYWKEYEQDDVHEASIYRHALYGHGRY